MFRFRFEGLCKASQLIIINNNNNNINTTTTVTATATTNKIIIPFRKLLFHSYYRFIDSCTLITVTHTVIELRDLPVDVQHESLQLLLVTVRTLVFPTEDFHHALQRAQDKHYVVLCLGINSMVQQSGPLNRNRSCSLHYQPHLSSN